MIQLENVSKIYPTDSEPFYAVRDVSLEISEGELAVLIGPSGSGKTTTMRMINRLVTLSEGRITVNGKNIEEIDAVELRRTIGYVIQQGGIFPHITVAENIAIVPRLLGWPKKRRRERAEELLALVGMPPEQFADRYPRQLSGGQRQRVGVARALAADPPIVLMDEPFGAVDPITRSTLQQELQQIQEEVHKTIVFVTHDIQEAFALADRIALMKEGALVQVGTPADLVCRPADDFVKEFIGEDRGLRMLNYIPIREIAKPAQGSPPDNAIKLSGEISVLDAVAELSDRGARRGQEIWIIDEEGRSEGHLTYHNLVLQLGRRVAMGESEGGEEVAHAVSP